MRRRLLDCLGWPRGELRARGGRRAGSTDADRVPLRPDPAGAGSRRDPLESRDAARPSSARSSTPTRSRRRAPTHWRVVCSATPTSIAFVAGLGGDAPLAVAARRAARAHRTRRRLGARRARRARLSRSARARRRPRTAPETHDRPRDRDRRARPERRRRAAHRIATAGPRAAPAKSATQATAKLEALREEIQALHAESRRDATTTSCSASRATPMPPPCAAPTSAPPSASIPTRSRGSACSTLRDVRGDGVRAHRRGP